MIRLFELFLAVCMVIFIIYTISYIFIFPWLCESRVKDNDITSIAICKDSLVCEIEDLKTSYSWVEKWSCIRKTNNFFTLDYYKNKILSDESN